MQPTALADITPLSRVPLIPENIVRRHNVHFEIDTRFRRAARFLQYLWLTDHGIPTGIHVQGTGEDAVTMDIGSCLSAEAAEAGKNFLSPAIHGLVRHELIMREEGAMIDEDRLFRNALSSMPLVFNLFGPMVIDLRLATAVFRALLPDFVNTVESIRFEHSPGRHDDRFLSDGTAVDVAMSIITPDGEVATIFVEVKYSEDMTGPAARLRPRYDDASRQVGLFKDPDSQLLRSLALEQLWREHMIAQLAVNHGNTSRALFITIAPKLNRRANAAFRVYRSELRDAEEGRADHVGFQSLDLEEVIKALATTDASEMARKLWARYCDFERVYRLALDEFPDTACLNINTADADQIAKVPASRQRRRSKTSGSSSNANK
ncbi:hypothetical protein FXV83_05310 [Bradyrhizobium hipponense]|uniref:PD-(D/E)XK nuclease-like domain-containing protein n=1 Tax=Bradyrhizobium hipponense TaxID=2605638 RepID=A0A5S4YSN9_9BRAD|nr:hypothetical protein [Bradyrhizobium hipponense]TYO67400.1 hypothetical protein FXV83_05310 [Bradyrhizobium hipponense]